MSADTSTEADRRRASLRDLVAEHDVDLLPEDALVEMVMDRIAQAEARGAARALREGVVALTREAALYQGFPKDKVRRATLNHAARTLGSMARRELNTRPARCEVVTESLRCVFDEGHGCDHGFDAGVSNDDWCRA